MTHTQLFASAQGFADTLTVSFTHVESLLGPMLQTESRRKSTNFQIHSNVGGHVFLFVRDSAHNGLNATRCLCVVFINASTSTVQFLEMR